jgi:hypothetical protein
MRNTYHRFTEGVGIRPRRSRDRGGSITPQACMPKEHTHICAECDAACPCPDPDRCPSTTAGERTDLCPQCEAEQGVEILSRSEDGFEAIIRSRPKDRVRVQ